MKPLKVVIIILIATLITFVYFDVAQSFTVRQISLDLNNLTQRYDSLNQSYNDLYQTYMALNQTYSQLTDDINHYNDIINQDPEFQTPISKSQAIRIALAYDGWNATTLRGQTLGAVLQYISYTDSGPSDWISYVTEPVTSYSPAKIEDKTYRYVWTVYISYSVPYPMGYASYFIDASSGEILGAVIAI